MVSIAHIINPVIVPESSDLFVAQSITFETMRRAHDYSASTVDVSLFSAQYSEDRSMVPGYIKKTRDLDTSIRDINNLSDYRKLPSLKEILDRLYEASNADYFIYTNVDIGLRKEFYTAVNNFISKGYDAFSITRRTISNRYNSIQDLSQIDLDIGMQHPGWDCFVFSRKLYPEFELEGVYLGLPPIGRILFCNCIRYATRATLFRNVNLTFHIGGDGPWKGRNDEAWLVNMRNGYDIVNKLYLGASDASRKPLLKYHLDEIERRSLITTAN